MTRAGSFSRAGSSERRPRLRGSAPQLVHCCHARSEAPRRARPSACERAYERPRTFRSRNPPRPTIEAARWREEATSGACGRRSCLSTCTGRAGARDSHADRVAGATAARSFSVSVRSRFEANVERASRDGSESLPSIAAPLRSYLKHPASPSRSITWICSSGSGAPRRSRCRRPSPSRPSRRWNATPSGGRSSGRTVACARLHRR